MAASHGSSPVGSLDRLLAAKEIVVACGPGGVGKTTTAAALAAMAACHHGGKVLVLTIDPARRLADALGLSADHRPAGTAPAAGTGSAAAGTANTAAGTGPANAAAGGGIGNTAAGGGIGNTERRIPDDVFRDAGITPRGELWAAMLDTKESWDALVRRHAPDAATRDQILANPLYRNIAGRFVQSHDYIAMERLYEIHADGDYDLIVVDTPPTRNALDFLDAPQRMADFFSSRLLRWLIVPYRSRLVNMASKPFYQVADRILGTQFLADIAEFFVLFQSMYDGFVARAESVSRLLSDRRTTFMVVSTLEATPVREAEFFATELVRRQLHLGAVVLNKVLPDYFRDPAAAAVATAVRDRAGQLAADLATDLAGDAADLAGDAADLAGGTAGGAGAAAGGGAGGAGDGEPLDPDQVRRVLEEVADSFVNFRVVACREAEQQAELATTPEVLATVPFFDADIYDMAGLLRLGAKIWS
ncbi:MAG TPA: ArsA-related P-loop ATPase [Acidimicrobiales bacterium]|nr:ArsA-related P-loop ATPase [Acidimicrobiales bacterium]